MDVNNTIMQLSFEQVTAITLTPVFICMMIALWLIPLILYVVIGAVVKARPPSNKRMMSYANYWYGFFILFLLIPALMLIIVIFPLWLKWF